MRIENAAQFKAAREKQRLTKTQTAELMRLPRPDRSGYATVTRWEETGSIPGPAMAHMETLATGWRPAWWSKK